MPQAQNPAAWKGQKDVVWEVDSGDFVHPGPSLRSGLLDDHDELTKAWKLAKRSLSTPLPARRQPNP